MPVLKNTRHERFAQLVAQGKNYSEAYSEVGYAAHAPSASRLLRNAHVSARLSELQTKVEREHDITLKSLIDDYRQDRDLARELKQPAAAISATTWMAKLTGHMVERSENKTQIDLRGLFLSLSSD